MKKFLVCYLGLATFFVIGFYTRGSAEPEVFIYSWKYFALLVVITVILLGAVPLYFYSFLKRHPAKELWLNLLPSLFLVLLCYVGAHYYFYSQQVHPFDPFLQMPPPGHLHGQESESFRILCLGGSTTANFHLQDSVRYPAVLERIIRNRTPDLPVEVHNAGMDWFTTKHSLINYVAYCRNYDPDVVIIMHSFNDLCRSFSPKKLAIWPYESDYSHYYGPSYEAFNPATFEKSLYSKFRFFWYPKKLKSRAFELSEFYSRDDFENYLSSLVEILKQDGAKVVLVTQPYLYDESMSLLHEKMLTMNRDFCALDQEYPDATSMVAAMDMYNQTTARLAKKHDVLLVDAEPEIPKDADHFIDDIHYTAKGSAQLGATVAKELLSSDYLDTNYN
jgi:lysophospholipase L1-like esterase